MPLLSRAYRPSPSLVSLPRDGTAEITAGSPRMVLPMLPPPLHALLPRGASLPPSSIRPSLLAWPSPCWISSSGGVLAGGGRHTASSCQRQGLPHPSAVPSPCSLWPSPGASYRGAALTPAIWAARPSGHISWAQGPWATSTPHHRSCPSWLPGTAHPTMRLCSLMTLLWRTGSAPSPPCFPSCLVTSTRQAFSPP